MRTLRHSLARPLVVALLILASVVAVTPRSATAAVTLPAGFSETLIAAVTNPTAMQFAPDGRLFVCEQRGTLRVIKEGALLPAPFVSLPVDGRGERGLLGVAFDPAFAANQYVYVYYTATSPSTHNRVSRFTASGDVAVPGSEVTIFDLPSLSIAQNHNGGALNFGADGKLYIAVGENNVPANSQSLTTTMGKMLRINADGSIPGDNPFAGSASGANRAIWALGLRNPFTFAFDPTGTRMFINDVGESNWEEINDGMAGANYGWPNSEGNTSSPGITGPLHTYSHASGCAITGGAFYPSPANQFPDSYSGVYFFTDICGFFINMLDPAAGNAVTTFATGVIYPVALAVSSNGDLYYLDRDQGGVHRISYLAGSVTADSVTPSSGSGAAQTFTLRYSNSSGAAQFASAFALITGATGGSCVIHYAPATNTVGLLNDAGTQYLSGTAGSSSTLMNSRCAVALASTAAVPSGNTLRLQLAMGFAPAFAGAKTIYLTAANTSGSESGWQLRGAWTVPGGAASIVSADAITPASGSGASQVFTLQASDTSGATNLQTVYVWLTSSPASTSCLAYYDRPSNTVGLLNDSGVGYGVGTAGMQRTLSNSQCSVSLGSTTTSISGNTLTINIPVTFPPAFAGAKVVRLYARNGVGASTGWAALGNWTVPATGPTPAVTADSIVPASGSGAGQLFAMRFSDTTGAANLATAFVLFSGSGGTSCLARYDSATRAVSLLNDAGNGYLSGTAGGGGTIANSRCAVSLPSSTATVSGNVLTLNLTMAFAASFSGAMTIYLHAVNGAGFNSGWQSRGTWTVPSGAPPAAVTADSITPASGSGASQVFAVRVSDTTGAINLATTFVLFSGASSACVVYHDRASNTIGLLNDAGTQYASGTAGAAAVLTNSRCVVALASSMAVTSGTMLTLNVAMSFTPAFAGAKSTYVYAANIAGMESRWQPRGTWTVP